MFLYYDLQYEPTPTWEAIVVNVTSNEALNHKPRQRASKGNISFEYLCN